jgi:putative methionine-R-sulfoxide reductase with GAF domain
MATASTNQSLEEKTPSAGVVLPLCPSGQTTASAEGDHPAGQPADPRQKTSQRNALQSLLAFSALREQVLRRKTLESGRNGEEAAVSKSQLEHKEPFSLDEVLQLVAERAVAITGADGVAIALAESNEIALRAAAGTVRPDLDARIDRDSTFSGACFRTAQAVICNDTETDARVNLQACRCLGARSMIAVPLCKDTRGIGLLQAFSAQPFGFDDDDVRNLNRLAELVLGALTLEDEERFAESAQVAAAKLEAAPSEPVAEPVAEAGKPVEEPHGVTRRPGMVLVLLCIMIAAALAAGVTWKLKPLHWANKMARIEKVAPKPIESVAKAPPPAPAVGLTSNPAGANLGATSKGAQAVNPPRPRLSSNFPMVTGIEHSSSADSTTVVLNVEDQVHYDTHRLANPDRIYFDLHNTELASNLAWKTFEVDDAMLKCIRVAQPVSGVTRVVLETKTHADFSVRLEPNPYRLVVGVRK